MINFMILLLAGLCLPYASAFSDSALGNFTRDEKTLSIFNVVRT